MLLNLSFNLKINILSLSYILINLSFNKQANHFSLIFYSSFFFQIKILVEFDEKNWDKREWIKVYEPDRFQLFLIEHMLVWCNRKYCSLGNNINWPALVCCF